MNATHAPGERDIPCAVASSARGHGNNVPNGFAGSVAARKTASGLASLWEWRKERSISTAAGIANCEAPKPATNMPRKPARR